MFLIISDTHFGLTRKTGVTAESLVQYENDKIYDLALLMAQHEDKEVIIAGDLFDSNRVALHVVLQVATALLAHPKKVWVIAGNHDLSKNTLKMSSLTFMAEWLKMHSTNVEVVFEPTIIFDQSWKNNGLMLVPHMSNQTLFDEVIEATETDALITHCNYENNFAVEKDHSLNLTKAQAKKFKMVISGHEHNARTISNVHMIGSFTPCNVGEAAVQKQSNILNPATLLLAPMITGLHGYEEIHWKNLNGPVLVGFLKIVGEATAAEAPTVLSKIAALRKASPSSCYMIQNAVTVESIELGDLEGASFESVDTMELLGNILSDKHKNRLGELGYVID